MVKIGLIGCGKIAERHLAAYRLLPGVEVTVFDINEAAARRRAEQFGAGLSPSLEALLSDPGIAAVDVCVPTPWHAENVVAGLRHGKHVFCEKPLCASLQEARAIHAAAGETNKRLVVGYPYRFYPAIEYVKQVLDTGAIGRPHFALLRLGGRGDAAAWKHQQAHGGGAILEMMVHELDMALWYFQDLDAPRVLFKRTLLAQRQIGDLRTRADAEDCVVASLEANGVHIICQADLATPSYMNHFEIQGENGSIFSSMLHYLPTQVFLKQARGGFPAGATTRSFAEVNVFERELGHFVSVIRGEAQLNDQSHDWLKMAHIIQELRTQRGDDYVQVSAAGAVTVSGAD